MPKNKSAAVRYRAIDQRIRRKYKPFPTIEDLIEAVEEATDGKISKSSIQKDIEAMKNDPGLGFNAPIEFSRREKGYHYTVPGFSIEGIPLNDDELSAIEFAASILEQFEGTEFMKGFEGGIEKIRAKVNITRYPDMSSILQIEKPVVFGGWEHLNPLITYIKNKEAVQFSYRKFTGEESKMYTLHPYLLKEYHNRWYLLGYDHLGKTIKTFGLDRLSDLNIASGISYFRHPEFDPEKYFKHTLGITIIKDADPEEIELSFKPLTGKYIKSQPWHFSQKEIADTSSEYRITLTLTPSMELVRQILSYGNEVRIIKPAYLAQDIEGRRIIK